MSGATAATATAATAAETAFAASAVAASGVESAGLFATIGGEALGAASTIASVSPYISAASGALQLLGVANQAEGYNAQGAAAKEQAALESQQLKNNANNDMASAEIKMENQNRETAYVLSNAQAAAAAGGGSATDPTVTTNMKTIAGEGRYRALTDMYEGQAAAQNDTTQAQMDIYSGDLQASADKTKMYSTILGGGSSLFDKYASVGSNSNTKTYGDGTPNYLQTS